MALHSSPHVLMLPCPVPGHYIPILQIAKRLLANGITITYVSTDQHITELQTSAIGQEFSSLGLRLVKLGDGMSVSAKEFLLPYMQSGLEEKLTGLLEAVIVDLNMTSAHIDAPCCILADLFPSWAQDVAYKFRIPRHVISTCAAVTVALDFHIERLVAEGYVPVTSLNQSKLITCIPGVRVLKPLDLPPDFHNPDQYKDSVRSHKRINEASVVLVNTANDLEGTVLDALKTQVIGTDSKVKTRTILEIGPLMQPESEVLNPHEAPNHITQKAVEERDPCVHWLNRQAPSSVLFICFGTLATISAPQILELAQGLEASKQPFLWIMRTPNAATASPSLIAPSITELLPSGFEERTQERGLCFSGWAPQSRILSHAATGAFLTHCGWNSVLEGLRAGIPLLTWPIQAEQMLNARVVLDQKVAIEMRKRSDGLVEKTEVERNVRLLMHEDEGKAVRQKVAELKICLRKAVADGGSSERNLEVYVQHLRTLIPLQLQ